jgi:hypothetical protein
MTTPRDIFAMNVDTNVSPPQGESGHTFSAAPAAQSH